MPLPNWQSSIVLGALKHGWRTALPPEPGIYVIKANWPINRVLSTDPAGILYVGMSRNLQNRVWAFPYGNHGASALLWKGHDIRMRILRAVSPSEEDCAKALAGCFASVAYPVAEPDLERAEHAVLVSYYLRFGEFPPMNSSAPDRWRELLPEDLEWAGAGLQQIVV
jgi:hypothetical protein